MSSTTSVGYIPTCHRCGDEMHGVNPGRTLCDICRQQIDASSHATTYHINPHPQGWQCPKCLVCYPETKQRCMCCVKEPTHDEE